MQIYNFSIILIKLYYMCSVCKIPSCKYVERITDPEAKKAWYIHYTMINKYFLKELFREEIVYEEMDDSSSEDEK